jgi:hypothetical protein
MKGHTKISTNDTTNSFYSKNFNYFIANTEKCLGIIIETLKRNRSWSMLFKMINIKRKEGREGK